MRTMVAPSATAAGMSADMPIDSVSSAMPSSRRASASTRSCAKAARWRARIGLRLGDRHQAAQLQAWQLCHKARQLRQFGRADATLASFTTDVNLKTNIQRRAAGRPLLGQALRNLEPLDRMHPVETGRNRPCLVALYGPNEMPVDFAARQSGRNGGDFIERFLQIVLAKRGLAGGNRLEDHLGREGFGNSQQLHLVAGAAGGAGGGGDSSMDGWMDGMNERNG